MLAPPCSFFRFVIPKLLPLNLHFSSLIKFWRALEVILLDTRKFFCVQENQDSEQIRVKNERRRQMIRFKLIRQNFRF